MDFDFGTLVYIAMGILYFIFTGVMKNKKKAQKRLGPEDPETVGPPPSDRSPTFEELLEEFTGKRIAEPEPEPIVEEPVKPVEVFLAPKPRPVKEKSKPVAEPLVTLEEYEEEELEEDYSGIFSDLDATKRAFIASEVFNRRF